MGDIARHLAQHHPAPSGPRILLFDLERLPGEFTMDIWEPRDLRRVNYMHPDRWSKKPELLCGSWLWYGESRPGFVSAWDGDVGAKFHELLDEATHAVTFNGNRADLVWLRKEWVVAGLPPPSPFRSVDLYVTARQFGFESRSLRYLCDELGVPNKSGHYNAAEAKAAAAGDVKARRSLKRYSVQDSVILAGVLDRLRPYMKGTNLAANLGYAGCPCCTSEDLEPAPPVTVGMSVYPGVRCRACGAHSRGGRQIRSAKLRAL